MQVCSAINIVKSFVIEAFGYHFSDIKNVFNIVGTKMKQRIDRY